MIKSFLQYLKENNSGIKIFKVTDEYIATLSKIKDTSKVAQILLNIAKGVPGDIIIDNPSNYFGIEKDGYISYLKPRYFNTINDNNYFTSSRRGKQKATKALREIYKPEYISQNLTDKDFEIFFNSISSIYEETNVVEFRGPEILRAFNYKKELHPNFSISCANFYQYELHNGAYSEPTIDKYEVYINNPDNIGVAAAIQNNLIMGRYLFLQGENLLSNEVETVYLNYYGVDGKNSKYDLLIRDYLKKTYNAKSYYINDGYYNRKNFIIKAKTRFKKYPPFDSVDVDFEHNLLGNLSRDNLKTLGIINPSYKYQAYNAQCPSIFLDEN